MKHHPQNDAWTFKQGFSLKDLKGFDGTRVDIPHTMQKVPLNYFDDQITAIEGVYQKTIELPLTQNKRFFIRFEGVMARCDVYLNETHVCHHKGGYTPFEIEVVQTAHPCVLTVHVDAKETADTPPFGGVIDYLTYGGIYREVTLIERPKRFFKHVLIHGDAHTLTTRLIPETRADEKATVKVEWFDGKTRVKHTTQEISLNEITTIEDSHTLTLWTLEAPKLYDVVITLEGEIVKTFRTGIRSVSVDQDHFYLNGEPLFLRGLNRHQSFPYVGYAMPKAAQEEDVQILKEHLQVNIVRSAHYPPSKHFLNHCDALGLLVFTELPGWQHLGDDAWKEEALRQLEVMTYEDFHHPSIVILGTRINESADDDAFYTRTRDLVKAIDPSRPTGGVRFITGSTLLEDIYTFNDFSHTGQNAGVQPKKQVTKTHHPYLITEHNGHMFPTKKNDPEEKRLAHALRHAKVMNDAYGQKGVMGVIGWVMNDYNTHKEFGSNDRICHHGVNDMMRQPKYAAAIYASQGDTPFVEVLSMMHLGDRAGGQLASVWVATNADHIELYKNDEYIGTFKPNKETFPHLPHPPVLIDDFIGERIAQNEPLSRRDANLVKGLLRRLLKRNLKMSVKDKLIMGYVLLKNKLSYHDAVRFYTVYVGGWGEKENRYTFKAYKNDQCFNTVEKGFNDDYRLNVQLSRTVLIPKETYDTVKVSVKMLNRYGEQAFYDDRVITIETEGSVGLIGPKTRTLTGGTTAFWLRSLSDGEGTLTVHHDGGKDTFTLHVKT